MTRKEPKRELGREADQVFKDIRAELASLLDNAIESSEMVPSPDLWSDYAMCFHLSLQTLNDLANELNGLSIKAFAIEDDEVKATIPR